MRFYLTAAPAAAIAVALAIIVPTRAQDYPSKPIRVLVPAAAGGIGDILPRITGQKLAERGHTIIVENRTGGAGVVAADTVAKAKPDDYLLLMGNEGLLSIRPHLSKLPYDTIKDLALGTPEAFGQFIANQTKRFEQIIVRAGIKEE